jgi:DhnA family fructose-bisphosphate aldolase class Ia
MNLSASTIHHEHTRKILVGTVADAVRTGADAIACHVNLTSPYEAEEIEHLSRRVTEAEQFGIPVVAMVYPRTRREDGSDDNYATLRKEDPEKFTALVRHCVRIAMELGASAVKTIYTGTEGSFRTVVDSAMGVPILIAGEAFLEENEAIEKAQGAIRGGAAGVAFGRQIFARRTPAPFVSKLRSALDDAWPDRHTSAHQT